MREGGYGPLLQRLLATDYLGDAMVVATAWDRELSRVLTDDEIRYEGQEREMYKYHRAMQLLEQARDVLGTGNEALDVGKVMRKVRKLRDRAMKEHR